MSHPIEPIAAAPLRQPRPGWWDHHGTRVCLTDVETIWNALHRAYFDEVGVGASFFLYLAGLRAAVAWSARRAPPLPERAFRAGLELFEAYGYGAFDLVEENLSLGMATVVAQDAMEAWSYTRSRLRASRPVCAYASGLLAGLWTAALERITASDANIVCWETECIARGDARCRFAIGPADGLRAQGIENPFEVEHVRWEMQDLTRKLRTSSARLTTVERELAERDRAYKNLLDNMNDVLLVLDRDKKVVFCNRVFLDAADMTIDQALGRSPLEWIHPEDRPEIEQVYQELLDGTRRVATYRFRVPRRSGMAFIESSARAIVGPSGETVVETLGRDVTERERTRQELESAHAQLVRKQRLADNDLRIAKSVHESLLPVAVARPELEIDIKYVPVDRVGGDYCHLAFPLDRYCVLSICDVSGHGMASALLAARVSSFLYTTSESTWDPLSIAKKLNDFLRRHFADTGLFVTFFAMTIDLETLTARYCGAGHPGPILRRAQGHAMETLTSQNMPVGIVDDFLRQSAATTVQLEPGDRLVIYTDGVTESMNAQRQPLRTAGLEAWIAAGSTRPLGELGDWLLQQIAGFAAGPPHDDMTLLLVEAKQPRRAL